MSNLKIGFSQEWDKCYRDNTQLSIWPWSDMVSLVNRHSKQLIVEGGRVLELGCGAGANIPLFRSLGIDYFGIEGSPTIVKQLHCRYPDLSDQIYMGDFTTDQPFDANFDLVVDRAAVTHNNTISIKNTLQTIIDSLKPGGLFIGVDWFSMNHTDYSRGQIAGDKYTRTNYSKGQFVGVGNVHFSDEPHLRDLFSKFEILFMEEKLIQRYEPHDNHQFASWNIVAKVSVKS
jgi:SAM-dependent methyltransferase